MAGWDNYWNGVQVGPADANSVLGTVRELYLDHPGLPEGFYRLVGSQ